MDNFKLYKHLIESYNISPYLYVDVESQTTGTYSETLSILNENYNLNEDLLLHLLFSKYIYDQELNIDNGSYIRFMLNENRNTINYYQTENLINNTYYFEDNFKIMNILDDSAKPYMNENIIDFDISKYASYNVKCYLFYLDIISQLYATLYELKKNKQSVTVYEIPIKSRYMSNGTDSMILYVNQNSSTFDMRIRVTRSSNDILEKTECFADRSICNIYEIFKKDVERHLNYFNGDDIKYTGLIYIKTIEYFYKLCRLKLMYMIAHSIYLLPYTVTTKYIHENIENYILTYILPVFTNFKNAINLNILKDNEMINSKNLMYNKYVIDTSTMLQSINYKLKDNKSQLIINKSTIKTIDYKYNEANTKYLISAFILFGVIISSLLVYNLNIKYKAKSFIFLIQSIFIIIVVIFIYSSYGYWNNNIEAFEDVDIIFPRQLPKPENLRWNNNVQSFYYDDDTLVRIKTSDILNRPFSIFDNNANTSWSTTNSFNNGNSIRNMKGFNYNAEWVLIDLGEYIKIKQYSLSYDLNIGSGAKTFKVFGANDNKAWVAINDLNNQTFGSEYWTLLHERTNINDINNVISYNLNNIDYYRFYLLMVNAIRSGSSLNIRNWILYGTRKIENIEIKIDAKTYNALENAQYLDNLKLPDNYDDSRLINWDINLYGTSTQQSVSAFVDLSIGTFNFNTTNDLNKSYTNNTDILDVYGSGYITGTITTNKNINNTYYALNVKYYNNIWDQSQNILIQNLDNISNLSVETSNRLLQRRIELLTSNNLLSSCNLANVRLSSRRDSSNNELIRLNLVYEYTCNIMNSNNILTTLINTSNMLKGDYDKLLGEVDFFREEVRKLIEEDSTIGTAISTAIDQRDKLLKDFMLYEGLLDKETENSISVIEDRSNSLEYRTLIHAAALRYVSNLSRDYHHDLPEGFERELSSLESATSILNTNILGISGVINGLITTSNANAFRLNGLYSVNSKYSTDILEATKILEASNIRADEAYNRRIDIENAISQKISDFNIRYSKSFTTVKDLNDFLSKRLIDTEGTSAIAERELAELESEAATANSIRSAADKIAAVNILFAIEIGGQIKQLDDLIRQNNDKLATKIAERDRIVTFFNDTRASSITRITQQYEANYLINLSIQNEITSLQIQTLEAKNAIAYQLRLKQLKEQEAFLARTNRDTLIQELKSKKEQLQILYEDSEYYQKIAYNVRKDIKVSQMIRDIDILILYSINDNINGINYDIVIPNMQSEYYHYNDYVNSLDNDVTKSTNTINNKILLMKELEAKTKLFLHISLIMSICMIIYHYVSIIMALIVAVLAIIIVIYIYIYNVNRPVRTYAYNYYWGSRKS
jgi:hypothetical protein